MDEVLVDSLLRWIERGRRDLPWRRRRDPYAVWISEVMLQQTQVATVVPYFERWMARFPDISSLAAAPLDDVLRIWEGLGYYARARNLHKAAQAILERHNGVLPSTLKELRALPGIGRYSAGAILSLAFGQPEPLLDGNVIRVLSRVYDVAEPAAEPAAKAVLWDHAAHLVAVAPVDRAGDLNEALIELGATLCTPANPQCPACPLASGCLSLARGTVSSRPVTAPRKSLPHHRAVAAILRDEFGRYLLVRRPQSGLLGGLWGFPGGLLIAAETDATALARCVTEQSGLVPEPLEELAVLSHTFTHFRMTLHAYLCASPAVPGETGSESSEIAWVDIDQLAHYPMAVTDRRIASLLESANS